MQQQRETGSSSQDPALIGHTSHLANTPMGSSKPCFATDPPEDVDFIEVLLERYNFQYILERVKKTTSAFPALKPMAEEIVSEVYDKFWQRLLLGTVQNPPAYLERMIHNKCIDHMRRYITEACHIIQPHNEEGLHILESEQVIAESEGLRDPAEEFEYKATLQECYQRIATAIAELPPRQQQAAAWHLLRNADDLHFLTELFNAFQIDIPIVRLGDKNEKHLLESSYVHARKALARRLDIDLSQFKQTK